MPPEQVDHAALAEDRKRDLRQEPPGREAASECLGNDLVQTRVPSVEQPVEIACAPATEQLDSDLERRCHAPDRVERQRTRMATFDPRDRRLRDPSLHREIALAQPAALADDPDDGPEPLIVHPRECGPRASSTGYLTRRAAAHNN